MKKRRKKNKQMNRNERATRIKWTTVNKGERKAITEIIM